MNNESEDEFQVTAEYADAEVRQPKAQIEVFGEAKLTRSLKEKHIGSKYTIIHCEGAIDSYHEAMQEKSQRESKRKSMENGLAILIERLGSGGNMSRDSFPPEGELPDGSRFWAFKRLPIRAYLWKSKRWENVYYISHYRYKLYDKLDPRDTARTCRNWMRIEVENEDR